jgi:5-methylcytosine-specific restriction endonuclease McrA
MTDQQRLITAGNELRDELSKRELPQTFHLRRDFKLIKRETGGWYIHVASWEPDRPAIALWLDKALGGNARHFWFGFWSNNKKQIASLFPDLPVHYRPIKKFTERDWQRKGQIYVFRNFPKIGHPFCEYYADEFYFGMSDNSGQALDTWRATEFIEGVIVACDVQSDEDYSSYTSAEGRRQVRRHLVLERDRKLARMRKEKDGFRCQVCDLRFDERYGKIGYEFAEAHHIKPLAQLKRQTYSRLDDLITVCANCHRMLHKMNGERADIQELKTRVKQPGDALS